MKSENLRKKHFESFQKLTLSERLNWAFEQAWFLAQFMTPKARLINQKYRRHGKKYFTSSHLASNH